MAKGKNGGGKNKPKAKASGKNSKKIKNQKTQTVAASSHRKPQQQSQNPSKKSKKDSAGKDGLSSMQAEMRRRLDGGKFRMLNEQLYTSTGKEAFKTFQSDPVLFDVVRTACLW